MGSSSEKLGDKSENFSISSSRKEKVEAILNTIDTTNPQAIRMSANETDNKPYLAWGLMWVDQLPFCFVAFNANRLNFGNSLWSVYVPTPAHEFFSPIPNIKGISEEEKIAILNQLGHTDITDVKSDFIRILSGKKEEYDAFRQKHSSDMEFREIISEGVKTACAVRETHLGK